MFPESPRYWRRSSLFGLAPTCSQSIRLQKGKAMKINCVSCGHNMTLDDAYDNFEGMFKCWVCSGLLQLKIVEGEVKSVGLAGLQRQPELTKNKVDLEHIL
jgi:hypothetical protein